MTKMRDAYPKRVDFPPHAVSSNIAGLPHITSISAHEHASAALRADGVVFTWGRVAVPMHLLLGQTEESMHRLEGRTLDKACSVLADRALPVANDALVHPGFHAAFVSVTEKAVVVVYEKVDSDMVLLANEKRHEERLRKGRQGSSRQRSRRRSGSRGMMSKK